MNYWTIIGILTGAAIALALGGCTVPAQQYGGAIAQASADDCSERIQRRPGGAGARDFCVMANTRYARRHSGGSVGPLSEYGASISRACYGNASCEQQLWELARQMETY